MVKLIYDRIKVSYEDVNVDLQFRGLDTAVCGNTASGKSYVAHILKRCARLGILDNIVVINDPDNYCKAYADQLASTIKNSKGKLFVIDNADDLVPLSSDFYTALTSDLNNQYLIFGRLPGYIECISDLAQLKFEDNTISLDYLFPDIGGEPCEI